MSNQRIEKATFAVLGSGAWGTAAALVLAQNPIHQVCLWSAHAENAALLQETRENVRLLPGIPIPPSINITAGIVEAVAGSDLLVVSIPTVYLRSTLSSIAGAVPARVPVVSLTKGIEAETFQRPTEIIEELWGPRPLAVLSGPSHAEEVGRGMPTTVVAASEDLNLAQAVQRYFHTDRFRVYTNFDLIGVELAGALKNIIGIAAGIGDGLGFGDNAKAALLTRGLAEMARFGVALGGEAQTFAGIAGMGDLITTCMSDHGRNRNLGYRLGRGEKLEDILAGSSKVFEGINTTRSVHDRAARMGIRMPITAEVYRVLYENKDPLQAVNDLMEREPKSERA